MKLETIVEEFREGLKALKEMGIPQEEDNPFWVPERLTRRILTPENDSRMDPLETTSSPHATSVELGS